MTVGVLSVGVMTLSQINKDIVTTYKFKFVIYSLRNTERFPFGTTQKRRSLSKGLENTKAHMKLNFVRDKYIPLKREYIKSLNGRSNVQLMVAKYGV
jgi:hypothetical protein